MTHIDFCRSETSDLDLMPRGVSSLLFLEWGAIIWYHQTVMNLGEKRVLKLKASFATINGFLKLQLSAPLAKHWDWIRGKLYGDIQSTHLTLDYILQVEMTKETGCNIALKMIFFYTKIKTFHKRYCKTYHSATTAKLFQMKQPLIEVLIRKLYDDKTSSLPSYFRKAWILQHTERLF